MTQTIERADIPTAGVDDVLLMISLETGLYHSLSGAGPRIWELLASPTTEEAVIKQLMAEYDVPLDVCTSEVEAFIAELRARDLLTGAR